MLLLLTVLGLALPAASGSDARSVAEAGSKPCPSKLVLKACLPDTRDEGIAPRGATAIDGSCLGKAIGAHSFLMSAPAACGSVTFDLAAASWSEWSSPPPEPPPRS
ncbi:hypothetical protein [Aureimonas sp. SK2]|uniref:hypothetical protein n=1 Tax=Aureimonas sp. SK2 TaxID=3015992 RepID=UPI0024450A30|nr:hypothetical protein [Aureimonas sp. SK2]